MMPVSFNVSNNQVVASDTVNPDLNYNNNILLPNNIFLGMILSFIYRMLGLRDEFPYTLYNLSPLPYPSRIKHDITL